MLRQHVLGWPLSWLPGGPQSSPTRLDRLERLGHCTTRPGAYFWGFPCSLVNRRAAVDDVNGTGSITRQMGSEVKNGSGDVENCPDSFQCAILRHKGIALIAGVKVICCDLLKHVRVDSPRTYCVDPDIGSEFPGMTAGHVDQPRFREAID